MGLVLRLVILLVSCCSIRFAHGQIAELNWIKKAGGNGYDDGWGITSKNDLIFVCGRFENTANFSGTSLTSSGSYDGFLVCYNLSGDVQWAKKVGGIDSDYCRAIAADNGNIYIAGNFESTMNIGDTTLISDDAWDVFVACFSQNGDFIWARKAGGIGDQWPTAIHVGLSGYVNVAGNFYNNIVFDMQSNLSNGSSDIFAVRYNSLGEVIFETTAGGNGYDTGNACFESNSGELFITGGFEQTIVANNDTLLSNGGYDIYLLELNVFGDILKMKSWGGTSSDVGYGVSANGEKIALVGAFKESVSFGLSSVVSNGNYDGFILSLDESWNTSWITQYGGLDEDRVQSVAIAANDDVYIGGYYSSNVLVGTESFNSAGYWDAFVSKLDSSGNYEWNISGGGSGYDICRNIIRSDSSIYFTGYFNGSANFGGVNISSSFSSYDIFVGKINEHESTLSFNDFSINSNFNIVPNPSLGEISLEGLNGLYDLIEVFDLAGKLKLKRKIDSDVENFQVDLTSITAGIYFIRLSGDKGDAIKKIVLD